MILYNRIERIKAALDSRRNITDAELERVHTELVELEESTAKVADIKLLCELIELRHMLSRAQAVHRHDGEALMCLKAAADHMEKICRIDSSLSYLTRRIAEYADLFGFMNNLRIVSGFTLWQPDYVQMLFAKAEECIAPVEECVKDECLEALQRYYQVKARYYRIMEDYTAYCENIRKAIHFMCLRYEYGKSDTVLDKLAVAFISYAGDSLFSYEDEKQRLLKITEWVRLRKEVGNLRLGFKYDKLIELRNRFE